MPPVTSALSTPVPRLHAHAPQRAPHRARCPECRWAANTSAYPSTVCTEPTMHPGRCNLTLWASDDDAASWCASEWLLSDHVSRARAGGEALLSRAELANYLIAPDGRLIASD